ncbi:Probable D-lactate dehydrogenase, mitochondrial [Geodia barretti]|nr:Probable D-lactate dehydrogenase, mitochondrial [Geodia barretti]
MIPYGVGTSVEGNVCALEGGVTLDMGRMNQVLRVSQEDLDVTVQAGVTRKQLNTHLRDTGLFFPIDPGADATLGGMTATRASGTNAVRYGTLKENVLGLTVVLPDGQIIKTGGRARKSAAGYDLTRLFVGSEGTLGVMTEITLKLYGIPEAISAAVCSFPSLEAAVNTVILTIQSGIPIARVELLDDIQMDACNKFSKLDYAPKDTLFFEFHGTERGVAEQVEQVREIVQEFGGSDFRWSTKPEERNALWQARHDVYYACLALQPGKKGWATDVCVPISRLAECLIETKEELDASPLLAPIVGPRRRRQFPRLLPHRPGRSGRDGRGQAPQRTHDRPRTRHGRDQHGRARHRLRQAGVPGGRARRRGRRPHAHAQADGRSPQPDESRESGRRLTAGLCSRLWRASNASFKE